VRCSALMPEALDALSAIGAFVRAVTSAGDSA
jgi:hypothetical protein